MTNAQRPALLEAQALGEHDYLVSFVLFDGEVLVLAHRPKVRACATSAPSTPSCGWWRLFAVRLGSGVGHCRRWTWRMRCWMNAASWAMRLPLTAALRTRSP
jgi:hypothetical protein